MNHTTNDSSHVSNMNEALSVTVEIVTPTGKWTMEVALMSDPRFSRPFLQGVCILGCLFFSILFAIVLVERQLHKLLLYKIMPQNIIHKLNKNEIVVERYNIVTIFFSDIVGFTSLAGEMRPIQVMKMLNELYSEFDKIVEKHGVYKVETVGDAYMVVGGAPEKCPAPEAAQKVTLFALELVEFVKNFRTSDGDRIYVRAGIASGPAVAGVVGKSMPRYCKYSLNFKEYEFRHYYFNSQSHHLISIGFFGDTVNTASRMESTSASNKIQCMDLTQRLLQDAPCFLFHLEERVEDGKKAIAVKGKGMTHTWWVNGVSGLRVSSDSYGNKCPSATTDVVIQSVALCRQEWARIGMPDNVLVAATSDNEVMIDRIAAILEHRLSIAMEQRGQDSMRPKEKQELRLYVSVIASMYKAVEFHNFEHCVHVTTSMNKVIDTIMSSIGGEQKRQGSIYQELWQNSFIHFVMIFGCLIHDVEHTGQSNKILEANGHQVSKKFPGPTAERNSIYIALKLLHQRRFSALKKAIMPSTQDRFQFGKFIFWSVLGTDIASPENLGNVISRFDFVHNIHRINSEKTKHHPIEKVDEIDAALSSIRPYFNDFLKYNHVTEKDIKYHPNELTVDLQCLEYCVVTEHLMQLSDVSHSMQDWGLFLKFNFRYYKELMDCHRNGYMSDPTPDWAKGQVGFFTNYVIPLAKRVETICGSDVASLKFSENANYNMEMWQNTGELIKDIFLDGYLQEESEAEVLKKCAGISDIEHYA